jgi:hypothetical protein
MAHAKFHISGQGLGEHQRGGALQRAAKQVGGTGRLKSQGPPGLTSRADLGKFHRARRLGGPTRDARHDPPAGEPESADTSSLVHHGPGGRSGIIRAERPERERPLPPGLKATTGAACCIEDSRTAVAHLHLEGPACTDLYRQSAQNRADEVGVLARFRLGGEPPEPSGDRGIQLTGQDPPHLDSAPSRDDRVPWRPGKGRGQGMLRHPRSPRGDRTGSP